ncbi:hypothetical protein F511_11791 [Dorcoceras hygrometricum]|uniref:Uncharacterized protein n=1 Tax=Dorcoceras hygrometricum TaxID=472368 RepID=A0A2Z7CDQ0_9LAMI|nr:hypothetical protein F511_11791 [Dorcoceras hygrometricum]
MSIFYQEEESSNPSNKCKCIASALKDAFAKCHSSRGKLSVSSLETDDTTDDFDEEDEVFVSAIISKYMESKCKRKSAIGLDNVYWALSPRTPQIDGNSDGGIYGGEDTIDEFYSVNSRLSRCSSGASFETFVSVKKWLSRSSSLNQTNSCAFGNRSMIMEFCHYDGWPFGLFRKALLLPPLPKSPADSWSWRKSGRTVRIHG